MISVNLVPPESILVSTIAETQQQVKFFAFNNDSEYIYSGVDYDSSIYESDFINSAVPIPNQDSTCGVIDCTIVNKVAADFLATQIIKYY